MDYIYSVITIATKLHASDFYNKLVDGNLIYICYHITTNCKYPFIQIMLDKLPYNPKQIYKEEFLFPSISITPNLDNQNINKMIIDNVNSNLNKINCRPVSEDAYMGIISKNNYVFALINASETNINHLKLSHNSSIWFALPTEIINIGSIYNIPISPYVSTLFTYNMPELCVLHNLRLNYCYLSPDVAYTFSKNYDFQLVFGPSKNQGYYHFFKSDIDTRFGVRYAVFLENQDFTCDNDNGISVKEYDLFLPLSALL